MQLSDIYLIDEPYTPFLITPADLERAAPLAELPAETKNQLARIGEGVVESALNHPCDTNGARSIARAGYREEVIFQRDRLHWRLGRAPATVISATLDDEPLDLGDMTIHGSTGVIRHASGVWRAGARLSVDYEGGWRTPAQLAQGAENDAPRLPAEIVAACARAAQVAFSTFSRDAGVRAVRENDADAGGIDVTYAAPLSEAGMDQEIFRLLAPWRRLALA